MYRILKQATSLILVKFEIYFVLVEIILIAMIIRHIYINLSMAHFLSPETHLNKHLLIGVCRECSNIY